LTTRYRRGDVVDQLLARIDGSTACWYVTDHLGSIRKVLDSTGVVKDAITYDAWGNILTETDANERGRYAWTSREIDVETGLQYNRARYYDATTGRWISQDPLGFDAGDSNLYRYVKNAPDRNTDPSGYEADVQVNGKNVTITLPIRFHGDGATKEAKEKFIAAIQQNWSGEIGGYKVKTIVTTPDEKAEEARKISLRYLSSSFADFRP